MNKKLGNVCEKLELNNVPGRLHLVLSWHHEGLDIVWRQQLPIWQNPGALIHSLLEE